MAIAITVRSKNKQGNSLHGYFTLAFSGNYATGGDACDFTPKMGFTTKQPSQVIIRGKAGYIYEYDYSAKKVMVRQTAPAGTIDAPIFTGTALATHVHDITLIGGITATEPVAVQGGDTLGKNAATNRTIAGANSATKGGVVAITAGTPTGVCSAPTFTGTAAAASELPATSYPAGVTGDTVYAEVIWN